MHDPLSGLRPDPLSASAASAHLPASARLYLELRRRIVSLELPPDTTLDRSEIAAEFNVSQSPVREAIQRLEQDGLVVSYPQSRTVVTRIDQSQISEEHFLRVAVESEVVRRLAESADPKTIVSLRGYLRLQEALVEDVEQSALFRQLDNAFHDALFEGVNQAGLHRHIVSRSGHLERVRTLDLPRVEKMRAVYEGHKQIVEAIEERDAIAAPAAMRVHLSGTIERLLRLREEHKQYFS